MTRLATLNLAAASVAVAIAGAPAAIVNRQLASHGQQTFTTPNELAMTLFHGSSRVETGLRVVVAVVVLGALSATACGVYGVVRGQRGALELTGSGVFGLLGLMAALTVVM